MVEFKEACRLFWIVKGHLNASDDTILNSYDGYFKRLWGNHEAVVHEEGFDQAFVERENSRDRKKQ